MPSQSRFATYWPMALVTVVHILAVGVLYGTLTTEMQVFNKSLIDVVGELKETNKTMQELKENDIRLEYIQKDVDKRVKRLETKHP
jgi:uncharacterized membrane protein (DUF106 family)